jgi:hypothetical protein
VRARSKAGVINTSKMEEVCIVFKFVFYFERVHVSDLRWLYFEPIFNYLEKFQGRFELNFTSLAEKGGQVVMEWSRPYRVSVDNSDWAHDLEHFTGGEDEHSSYR